MLILPNHLTVSQSTTYDPLTISFTSQWNDSSPMSQTSSKATGQWSTSVDLITSNSTVPHSKMKIPTTTAAQGTSHPSLGGMPNFFLYKDAMWATKVALPISLFVQTLGHVFVLTIYKRKMSVCDSLIFIVNYLIADTVLLVYMIVVFTLQPGTCLVVQILYNIAIVAPIYAVFLITLKRFVRVLRPLRCSFILTRSRETFLAFLSWLVVVVPALMVLADLCGMEINRDISYCYYSQTGSRPCRIYIGFQITIYFCVPLIGVLLLYGIMLKESRKAFQKEAFVSFLRVNNSRYALSKKMNTE